MTYEPTKAVEVFYSYAHKDEKLRNALVEHLSTLRRQGYISEWHDRQLVAGTDWAQEIDVHLHTPPSFSCSSTPTSSLLSNRCLSQTRKYPMKRVCGGANMSSPNHSQTLLGVDSIRLSLREGTEER